MTIFPTAPGVSSLPRRARRLPPELVVAHIISDLAECGQLLHASSHSTPEQEFAARVALITAGSFRLELLESTASHADLGVAFPVYCASAHVGTLYVNHPTNDEQPWPFPIIDRVNRQCAYWVQLLTREMRLRRLDLPTDQQMQAVQRLSTREREVLQWLMGHQTVAAIASGLQISRRTVESHCAKVYEKLGVGTQHAARQVGLAAGLITPDTPS